MTDQSPIGRDVITDNTFFRIVSVIGIDRSKIRSCTTTLMSLHRNKFFEYSNVRYDLLLRLQSFSVTFVQTVFSLTFFVSRSIIDQRKSTYSVGSKIYNVDRDRYNQYLKSIHSNLEAGNIFNDKLIGLHLGSLFNTPKHSYWTTWTQRYGLLI